MIKLAKVLNEIEAFSFMSKGSVGNAPDMTVKQVADTSAANKYVTGNNVY
jgi:hypothetical protein